MYQITFDEKTNPYVEPQTIRVRDYRVLTGGVLELEPLDSADPRDVQIIAPQVWQNALIKFVGADGKEG